jgi:tetratricopeptide (TPR) repeat protein
VRRATGDYPGAAQALEQALDTSRDIGDRLGQAHALSRLGTVRRAMGDYRGAAQAAEQALDSYRDLGDRLGQANVLSDLGIVRRATGDYPGAAQALEQALGIYRDIGNRGGEAEALNERGTLYRVSGDLAQAEGCHQQAMELARAVASSWDEAYALAGLGRCALAAGHATHAEELLRQALEIFQRIGAAEVPDLLAELDALTGHEPPGSALGWLGDGSGEPGGSEDSGGRDRRSLVGASRGRFAAAGRPARRCRAGALERLPAGGGSRPLPGRLRAGQDGDRGLHRPAGGRGELRPGLPPVRPGVRQTGPSGR